MKKIESRAASHKSTSVWLGCLALVGIAGALFAACVGAAIYLFPGTFSFESSSIPVVGKDSVAVIQLVGVIRSGGGSSGLFSEASAGAEDLIEMVRRAEDNGNIKGILIRINSPGGSAAASQEIYNAINDYKKNTGNPVVVSMADVAASGGYYVAAASDRIFANPATLTGSIGVIMGFLNYKELLDNIGARQEIFKSGAHKDMGSPGRDLTDEERRILQNAVDDVHRQFVDAVTEGRGMDRDVVAKLADGRFYTGSQALEVGLVDQLGGYREALAYIGNETGLGDDPPVSSLRRSPSLPIFFGSLMGLARQAGEGAMFSRFIEGLMSAPTPVME